MSELKQNITITITPEQQEQFMKKTVIKRELASIRHKRLLEAHKDEIKAEKLISK